MALNLQNLKNKFTNAKDVFANALMGTPTTANNELAQYQNQLREQGYDENVVNGVAQGLNSGDKNIANWIEQYNKGAGLNNPINIPQTTQEIGKAREGLFNKMVDEEKQTQRIGGAIPDLVNGFQENATQGFNIQNLENKGLDNRPKGAMYRLGETLGTATRFFDKPIGRMAVATGLSYLTGEENPLKEGVTAYIGRQKNVTADQLYRNQLKQMGYSDEELSKIGGNITKEMFDSITSGMRLNNQRMTYGQLATLDDDIAKEIASNPELANQYVPVSIARDIYGKKRDLATSKMDEVKTKAEQNQEKINQGWKRLQILEAKGNLNEAEKAEYLTLRNDLLRIQIENEGGGTASKGNGAGRTRTQPTTNTKKATSHRTNAF